MPNEKGAASEKDTKDITNDGADKASAELEAKLKEKEAENQTLKERVEKAQDVLTSPEYLEFLTQKNNPKHKEQGKSIVDKIVEEPAKYDALPLREKVGLFVNLVKEGLQTELNEIRAEARTAREKSDVVDIKTQLKEAISDFPDFLNFKDDIKARLMDDPSLTVEKAYYQVKGEKVAGKEREARLSEKTKSEKPGSGGAYRGGDGKPKDFKGNKVAATDAAWEEVMGDKQSL